ncbi:MAG: tRNA pseudouridine(38-40) synthase TruA [Clostridia bacterium]
MNVLLKIAYKGTRYSGFQYQKNANSVANEIEKAITSITHEYIGVNGCSRTDKGVHALSYYLNFTMQKEIEIPKLIYGINAFLPLDIAVLDGKIVPNDFHARYDAKEKTYIYKIFNSQTRNPFYEDAAYRYYTKLDIKAMQKAAEKFIGCYDFKSFMSSGSEIKNTIRTVINSSISVDGDMITYEITADGYLYNMVRIIVGTLIKVGIGKISPEEITDIIKACDRTLAGPTAPGCGLYLKNVIYDKVLL